MDEKQNINFNLFGGEFKDNAKQNNFVVTDEATLEAAIRKIAQSNDLDGEVVTDIKEEEIVFSDFNLTLTPEQWVEKWEKVIPFTIRDNNTLYKVIERFRQQWTNRKEEIKKQKPSRWKEPLLNDMIFDSNKCIWIKDTQKLTYRAFVELVQSEEIKKSSFDNKRREK